MKKPVILFLATCAVLLASCGEQKQEVGSNETPQNTAPKTRAEAVALGEVTYRSQCMLCHGADGKLGASGAKDLSVSTLGEQDVINLVSYGRGAMMAYKDLLTKDQIENVAAYIQTLRKK